MLGLLCAVGLKSIVRMWDNCSAGRVSPMEVFLRDPRYGLGSRRFKQVLEKTTENSERLGRQTRTGIEPGTSL